jgi:hypothetical protein
MQVFVKGTMVEKGLVAVPIASLVVATAVLQTDD